MSAKINKIILFLFHFEEKNVSGPVKQVKKKCGLKVIYNMCFRQYSPVTSLLTGDICMITDCMLRLYTICV